LLKIGEKLYTRTGRGQKRGLLQSPCKILVRYAKIPNFVVKKSKTGRLLYFSDGSSIESGAIRAFVRA
jgi:hypothetical protein